eukprot:CAMPEP_0201282108 /NCGR_PEP_ID=MMETSP1317-20130820/4837_1 /ASSEMBLY_ACC=CAM_ASM_000770 /TAXON_ID=187299 /ORGANISM="Undescribed Undescribed, Strain Undescribed" /LENGTH=65 /DNA_ID=CAMNT_0047593901 /DNA_START=772 /DNA_END=969 /DNA_ORIENTATION=-
METTDEGTYYVTYYFPDGDWTLSTDLSEGNFYCDTNLTEADEVSCEIAVTYEEGEWAEGYEAGYC